jgi:hypothetical protein
MSLEAPAWITAAAAVILAVFAVVTARQALRTPGLTVRRGNLV